MIGRKGQRSARRLLRTAHARRQLRRAQRAPKDQTSIDTISNAVAAFERDVGLPGGPGAIELVGALHVLAHAHRAAVNLLSAVDALDRAMDALQRAGDAPQDIAWVCETLTVRGDTQRLQAHYEAAASDLKSAVDSAPDDRSRAGAYNALGILAKDTSHFDDAEAWYAQAGELIQALPAPSAPLATLLHNLAGLEHARGKPSEGETHIRRALQIREALVGDHAAVLSDQGVLAALLSAQRRDEEAAALLHDLIVAWSSLRGAEHYEVAHARHHLGVVLVRQGHRQAAKHELTLALGALQRILGADHPEVLAVRNSIDELPATTSRTDS